MPDVVEIKNLYRRNRESWFSHSNHFDSHEELQKVGFFYLCNSSAALWPRNMPKKHVKLSADIRSSSLLEYRQVSLQFLLQQCWLLLLKWVRIISTEEKLDVISWLEKGERLFYICLNVRSIPSSLLTLRDIAGRITESVKSGTKVFVTVAELPQFYRN